MTSIILHQEDFFKDNGGVTGSTGNRSLSKRVAMWNCFKSHIFQLNGKTTYGDKPNNKKGKVVFADFSVSRAIAA